LKRKIKGGLEISESSQSIVKVIRCIVCPTGCTINAKKTPQGDIVFEGYTCKRGKEYAEQEYFEPKRILTTTVRVENGFIPLVPVRTNIPILKEKLNDVLKVIAQKKVKAPIKMGDVIIKNVLNLGADLIASRDLNPV
jgi:CxxC motif-containing protein